MQFKVKMQLSVNASAGLGQVRSYEAATPSVVDTRSALTFGDLPDMTFLGNASYQHPNQRLYEVYDSLGNTTSVTSWEWTTLAGVGGSGFSDPHGGSASYLGPGSLDTQIPVFDPARTLITSSLYYLGSIYDYTSGSPILVTPHITFDPLGGLVAAADVKVFLRNGDTLDSSGNVVGTEQALMSNHFSSSQHVDYIGSVQNIALTGRYAQVRLQIDSDALCNSLGRCNFASASIGAIIPAFQAIVQASTQAAAYPVLAGSGQTLNLGGGITFKNFTSTQSGNISAYAVGIGGLSAPLGYLDANSNIGYEITMHPSDLTTNPFDVTVPFSGVNTVSGAGIKVFFYPGSGFPGGSTPYQTLTTAGSTPGGNMTITVPGPGFLEIVSSQYSAPVTTTLGPLTILSNAPGPSLSHASDDPRSQQILNVLANQGLYPVGDPIIAGPSGLTFSPPAVVTYTPPKSTSGLRFSQVSVADAGTSGLAQTRYDMASNSYSGYVSQLHSLFGVFAPGVSATLSDLLPPQTALLLNGAVTTSTQAAATESTALSFSALDPAFANAPVSGVAGTFSLIDTPFVSTATTPGAPTTGAFSLGVGTHTLVYYSVDKAGNVEQPHVEALAVSAAVPVSTLYIGSPSYAAAATYIGDLTPLTLTNLPNAGATSYVSVDSAPFSIYAGSFSLPSEGAHIISYYSIDDAGAEGLQALSVNVDSTPPITNLQILGSSATAADGSISIATGTAILLSGADPLSKDVASGIDATFYLVDANPFDPACDAVVLNSNATPGTCANPIYAGAFSLAAGTHTVYYFSEDNVGNQEALHAAAFTVQTASGSSSGGGLNSGGGVAGTRPPGVVSVVSISGTSAMLSWDLGGNPLGTTFNVSYATGASASQCPNLQNFFSASISTSTNSILLAGLSPLTAYAFGVCTLGSGCSGPVVAQTLAAGVSAQMNPAVNNCGAGGGSSGGGPTVSSGSGFAIAADASGQIWEVAASSSAGLALSHYAADGTALLSSTLLPQASSQGSWSLGFDVAANVYAVGSASSANGATSLAVYQVSPQGILLSSAVFQGGSLGNGFAFDATGGLWIAGALQTGSFQNGTVQTRLALWRYSPGGPLSLAATYARGNGGDAGFGVRASSGVVWVAGYSAATNAGLSGSLDLALWGFDPSSGTLTRGPFFNSGVLPNGFQNNIGAKLETSGGNIDVVAARQSGSAAQVGFFQFDQAGRLLLSRAWTPASGALSQINAIARDNLGRIAAAGQIGTSSAPTLGVWAYKQDGSFIGAFGDPAAPGAATGIAAASANTFLAVNGSGVPYAFTFPTTLAGSDVLLSSAPTDVLPPRTALSVGSPVYVASQTYVTVATPLTLTAVDDKLVIGDSVGLGVARTFYGVDSSSYAAYAGTFTLTAEGTHTVTFYSVDLVGNTEVAHSSTVAVDATAPRTSLLVLGGRQFPGPDAASFYASSDTRFTFPAIDPLVNGVASGVAWTRYQDSTGAFQNYVAALALAEGAHRLAYQSQDNVGNLEVARSTNVLVDATAPTTTVSVGSPTYAAPDGTIYVAPTTPVTFAAADPALPSGQAGSGVARVEVSVDGGAFSVYVATLTFAEGRHSILYRAVDNVGNAEAAKSLALQSDATPPITALKASGAFFAATAPEGTRLYAPPAFVYSLPATDPAAGNVASGVAFTRYRTGPLTNYASGAPAYAPGAFANYVSTFSLAEGVRRVDFQSQDNVANLELLKSATVFVDATPPATTLGIGAPQYAAGGTLYVSTATPFTLAAQDPVVQEVASGVSAIFFHRDADPAAPYASAFALALPDGAHAVSYYAADNAGNLEVVKTSTVALDATAPQTSLLVLGGRQFPGPDGRTFYASSDTRLALPALDPLVNGAASGLAFTRWQDNGGAFTVYVATLSLAEGAHALGYQSQDNVANLEVLRSTTVLVDATPPMSAVSIGSPTYAAADGTIYVTPATPVVVSAADPSLPSGQAGSGVARIEVSVDGAAFAAYAGALSFAEGRHALLYRAVDNVGNVEAAHALALQSDATPPVSALAIGRPQFALSSTTVLVSSLTPLGIAAVDPVSNGVASGVRQSFYNVGGGTFAVFAASFTLTPPDGAQVLAFYSQDNVLNTEAVKISTVVLDSTPPELALLSPGGCNAGICRVVKGKFPVLGTARDLHFASYVLDFAPGQNAATGYALISSGTVAVSSGVLGAWDATALSGWQTLRLTAVDLVANTAVLTENVFVGDPGELMALGNHDVFDMPQGVAADSQGNIYVADTNADRVAVYSATGTFLNAFGRREGEDDRTRSGVRLSKPRGVAVDAAGFLYIADTNDNRVLKLSATGQVLLTVGRREKRDKDDRREPAEFAPGKKPGEFDKPSGLALDAAGNIYVADTGNGRVQKLAPDGTPLQAFTLPPVPARPGEDKDGDRDDRPAAGRPFGIALDGAGNIYVADPAGARALEFNATGQLLLTVPIRNVNKDGKAVWGRPFGVAVSTDGFCLLVSDQRFDRVLKFDQLGDPTLAFGAPARRDEGRKKAAGLFLRKPAGLALAPDGTLLVADRNDGRILRFGLPTGAPTLVVPPASPDRDDIARDVLDKDSGGTVARQDGAGVTIPAGALPDDLKITVSTISAASAAQAGAMDQKAGSKGLMPAYPPVEYGPEGTQFATPVQLVVPYNPQLVALQRLSEDGLKVHYWNKTNGDWEALESTVDKAAHTVSAKTPHFSLYQVLGSTDGTAGITVAAADASFGLKAAYAFPNPAHAGAVTIRIQPGLADSVSVRVYDLSGRKVHESADFTLNPALDDGNGLGVQYTYDHVWDISGVGSGVYTYVITAKHACNSDIHKTGKVGIAK